MILTPRVKSQANVNAISPLVSVKVRLISSMIFREAEFRRTRGRGLVQPIEMLLCNLKRGPRQSRKPLPTASPPLYRRIKKG